MLKAAVLLFVLWGLPRAYADKPFVHPGLLHRSEDFARIQAKLGAHAEPWEPDVVVLNPNRIPSSSPGNAHAYPRI